MAFWTSLSGREKGLLGLALIIAIGVFLQLLVFRPILTKQSQLREEVSTQSATLKELAIMPRVSGQTSVKTNVPTGDFDSLRQDVLASATAAGLEVNRTQMNNGSLALYFDKTLPELLFLWLRSVEAEYGLRPEKLSVRRLGKANVRASVEFVGG